MFKGPVINKKNGGLGRRNPTGDAVFGLIAGAVSVSGGYTVGSVVKLIQVKDAEDIGITAAYDANNAILVHYHIDEFFRLNPDGTLYFMGVAQGVSMTNICDKANNYAKKIIADADNHSCIYLGVVLNPDMASYSPTLTTGLDADVLTAIPKAQALIDDFEARNIFVDGIMIEGRQVNGTLSSIKDLRTLAARNVSVVIGQDPYIAALDADYAKHAAVGSALGALSVRKVHECLGALELEVMPSNKKAEEVFSLTDASQSRWLTASISSGATFTSLTPTEVAMLTDKGYIYAGSYEMQTGIFFNDSPTAVEVADDYAYIEYNRLWNKAARYVVKALTKKIKSTVDINDAGQIKPTTISAWEIAAHKQLKNILIDGEASKVTFSIDPAQNVNTTGKVLTKLTVKPKGIAREIESDIGFEA